LLFCKIQRQQSVLSVVLVGLGIILSVVLLKMYRLTDTKKKDFVCFTKHIAKTYA